MIAPTLSERLRMVCNEIRRNKMPLADLIPLLQQAADEIDRYEAECSSDYGSDPEPDAETGRVK